MQGNGYVFLSKTLESCVPCRQEKYLQLLLATDVSLFRWGAIIENDLRLRDFFNDNDTRPIYLKEAEPLYQRLGAIRQD